MVNEETLFCITDELILEAQEDNWALIKHFERRKYDTEDLCSEVHNILSQSEVDWSRLFLIAVLGVALNDR